MNPILIRSTVCFGLILSIVTHANAQTSPNNKDVIDVIMHLFNGMKAGDSAMVHATFTKQVTLATAYHDKNGKSVLERESSVYEFLKAVGTPHAQVWYEETWNIQIQVDNNFAQVWCDYAFYLDNHFSHCGIDAFHLFRDNDGWKIFHLVDTRRKELCEIPNNIKSKHN